MRNHENNTEERHLVLIETLPMVNVKYSLGYNQVIQKAICEDVKYYPYLGFTPFDMVASTIETNNKIYNQISLIDSPKFLFSLAKRSGGFHFIDYPLEAFNVLFQIHKNILLDLDLDFNNSYYRCADTALITTLPFCIPLTFKLQ